MPHHTGRLNAAIRDRDHASDQSAALLPHHQSVRTALSGTRPCFDGATTGPHHDRRRGSCHGSLSVQAARDLEMDYYGVSLHKWLLAPLGTGLLYVRKDRIESTWPLQAAPERTTKDIRKFEEIGTSPAATKAAINEAIAFQQAIGIDRKAARLRYLTLRWANELKKNPRIRLHSSL